MEMETLLLLAPLFMMGEFLGAALGALPVVGEAVSGIGDLLGLGDDKSKQIQKLLQGVGTAGSVMQGIGSSEADADRARELTNQSIERGNAAQRIARNTFQRDAPLRREFRRGALNFGNPTNPFSTASQQRFVRMPSRRSRRPRVDGTPSGGPSDAMGADNLLDHITGGNAGGGQPVSRGDVSSENDRRSSFEDPHGRSLGGGGGNSPGLGDHVRRGIRNRVQESLGIPEDVDMSDVSDASPEDLNLGGGSGDASSRVASGAAGRMSRRSRDRTQEQGLTERDNVRAEDIDPIVAEVGMI